jgi:hypothetical protein
VSQSPDRVLDGSALRHQLEQARQQHERIALELAAAHKTAKLSSQSVEEIDGRLMRQDIRLLGLEGDAGYVFGKVDGKTKLFDVQASKALPSWRLPDNERDEIIRKFEVSGTPD